MDPPRPPPRRPLTPVDQHIASIQCWLAGLQNSGRDLASVLRAPSPICCRPQRAPANAVPTVPAPPPISDLVLLGSALAPSTKPPLLGTPLARGVFLTLVQGFSPVGAPSSSTSDVVISTGPMPQAVARAGSPLLRHLSPSRRGFHPGLCSLRLRKLRIYQKNCKAKEQRSVRLQIWFRPTKEMSLVRVATKVLRASEQDAEILVSKFPKNLANIIAALRNDAVQYLTRNPSS